MRRLGALLGAAGLAALLAAAPTAAAERKLDGPFTIYMVQWRGHTATDDGFRDYLAAEGVPVRYVLRNADRKVDAIPEMIAEIKAMKPDLVFAWGLAATEHLVGTMDKVAAEPGRFLTDIPVVGCTVADPVSSGLAPSWQSTGRNFTGVSHVPPVPVQVNAMKVYDDLKSLAVLYNPAEQSPMTAVMELRQLAATEGYRLLEFPIPLGENGQPRVDALPGLIAKIARHKPTFMYMGPDSFLAVNRQLIADEANKHGLPTFGAAEVFIREAPGLVGLVSRYYNVGQYCGYKAREILVGRKHPKDIPFDTLKRFSYIVNKSTAHKLKYYPPLSIINFLEVVEVD